MTDFTVRIKKLPKVTNNAELDAFAQALTLHIERIVNKEEEVF